MKQIPFQQDNVTQLAAADFNEIPRELENAIESSDQTLSTSDLYQLAKAIATYAGDGDWYEDGGSANVYELSAHGNREAPPVYTTGQRIRFVPANTNTSSTVTIEIESFGDYPASNVVAATASDIDINIGSIIANQPVEFIYQTTTDTLTDYWLMAPVSLDQIKEGFLDIDDGNNRIRANSAYVIMSPSAGDTYPANGTSLYRNGIYHNANPSATAGMYVSESEYSFTPTTFTNTSRLIDIDFSGGLVLTDIPFGADIFDASVLIETSTIDFLMPVTLSLIKTGSPTEVTITDMSGTISSSGSGITGGTSYRLFVKYQGSAINI